MDKTDINPYSMVLGGTGIFAYIIMIVVPEAVTTMKN
jgi:hypothetical protein